MSRTELDPGRLWTLLLLLGTPGHASTTSTQPDKSTQVAYIGNSATLPCEAPKGVSSEDITLEWTKPGLDPHYVFLFRDGRPDLFHQDPQFKGRVELVDRSLQSFSLALRNISKEDNGTYECHILSQSHVRKRSVFDTEPIRVIKLQVLNPDPKIIRAAPGEDVFFPFEPLDFTVTALMWKRADLEENKYVFLHGMVNVRNQHPQFENRVNLLSQASTTRDLTVVLQDVQSSDSGTYHLHIMQSHGTPTSHGPFKTVELQVVGSRNITATIGPIIVALVIVLLLLLWYHKRERMLCVNVSQSSLLTSCRSLKAKR